MVRVFRPPNWNHCHQVEDDPDGARSDPTSSSGSYTHLCQWQSGSLSAFPDGSFTPAIASYSFTAPLVDLSLGRFGPKRQLWGKGTPRFHCGGTTKFRKPAYLAPPTENT